MGKCCFAVVIISLVFLSYSAYSQEEEVDVRPLPREQLHTQAMPIAVSNDLKNKNIGSGVLQIPLNTMGINFFEGTQISSREFVLNSNDEVCVGDTLKVMNSGLDGEWFTKGGPHDSPPVLWVDDITEVVGKINRKEFSTEVYRTYVCAWYAQGKPGWVNPANCIVDAQVICESSCKLSAEGPAERSGDSIKVLGTGKINITATCSPQCVVFIDRKAGTYQVPYFGNIVDLEPVYGYMVFCPLTYDVYYRYKIDEKCTLSFSPIKFEIATGNTDAVENIKEALSNLTGIDRELIEFDAEPKKLYVPVIKKSFTLTAKPSTIGPKLNISNLYLPGKIETDRAVILRAVVENAGDDTAFIEDIKLNTGEYRVIYSPAEVNAGTKNEILIEAKDVEAGNIKLDIAYKAEKLGCLQNKDFTAVYNTGTLETESVKTCASDADCPVGNICCAGVCRESAGGVCDDIDGDGEPDTWVEV